MKLPQIPVSGGFTYAIHESDAVIDSPLRNPPLPLTLQPRATLIARPTSSKTFLILFPATIPLAPLTRDCPMTLDAELKAGSRL